jgi:uncharacterized membrane protein
VTIGVVILIVYTLLRWIDHLSKLGRVGETIDRVENAVIAAINQRARWPYLGGAAYPLDLVLPASARTLSSEQTGYVQHIDVQALDVIAKERQIQLYLEVLPGSFVHVGMPVVRIVALDQTSIDEGLLDAEKILAALTIGVRRTFEHDPRFGLSVLSEIASRALSPAVNDPGTAIDVIGRGVRTLTCWGKPQISSPENDPGCDLVYLRGLTVEDLFDDFFSPISRDGAGLLEVNIRLLKALISLSQINPRLFQQVCSRHVDLLVSRANATLLLQYEKDQLSSLARTMRL